MNVSQKQQAESYITLLDDALIRYERSKDASELYDITDQIASIYSSEISEIGAAFDDLCQHSGLVERKSKTIRALLKNYICTEYNPMENELINNVRTLLNPYDDAQKYYDSALRKYRSVGLERNGLDDIRLSLELLLKALLHNDKSLENQQQILGNALKERNVSVELRNYFCTTVEKFAKYQNEHVKHKDNLNENESSFIMEWASVIIKFLIQTFSQEV